MSLAAGHARLAHAVALTLLVALPAFLNLAAARVFEEEKALLLRAGAAVVIALLMLGWRRHAAVVPWRHPVVLAFAAFVAVLTAAAMAGIAPRDAFLGAYARQHGLIAWACLAVLFLALVDLASTADGAERIRKAIVLASLWPCSYALLQVAGADPVEWGDAAPGRAASTLGNAILLGGYIAAVLPVTAALALQRPVYLGAVLLQLGALAASGSRGALIAAAASVFVFVTAHAWCIRNAAWRWGVSVAAVIAILAVPVLVGRAADGLPGLDLASGSARIRVLIWSAIADAIGERPDRLALGFGPESLRRVLPPYYDAEIGRIEQREAMPDRAHNETLDTLVAAGAAGLAAQAAFFAAVLAAALRIPDAAVRAGVTAAAVAHLIEIQFGIASIASRAVLVALAALAGAAREHQTQKRKPIPLNAIWIVCAAAIGAASGWVSTLNDDPRLATPLLYGLLLICSIGTAAAWRGASWRETAATAVAVALGMAAAHQAALLPSRADALAKAAAARERRQQWPEAATLYREALRVQPAIDAYLTGLARTLLASAGTTEDDAVRARDLEEARQALERAAALDGHDPNHARNLARLHTTRAATQGGTAREQDQQRADAAYRRATELAPGLPATWLEWARLDGDRGRFEAATEKVDRALALDASLYDAWVLRGHLHAIGGKLEDALTAYDRALALRPRIVDALRGRAIVLAQMQRSEDAARAAAEALALAPDDEALKRLLERPAHPRSAP